MTDIGDDQIRTILQRARVIAVVGLSADPVRPSHYVARYLQRRGKRVIPVNPRLAGQRVLGEPAYADLAAIPADLPVDMVDIFRQSDHVPPIVEEALASLPALRTVWMQIGVRHEDAAARARAAGCDVVQDRCPKIEYQRLFGELRMGGFATGIVSSRL
ncbi:CoA-binding protein [Rhodovulum adriaticum]|uniref:CoA-binding domain-containing protein n=1 Tax=Rhodovulum adriaticum TaxID=35804 RepID=A0A4R2NJ13_RHOAD|nr:CoA-binding protein [Rhodovulum adriaticum]MBK1635859.1 CoA-binding protein [Rhodovulum adriaticum]TCP21400.1 hypothetical protein EV656_11151 [Rhodovulum adriaticum]